MATHSETVTLPHTELQVPAKHPQVVPMSSLPTPDGTALVALVRFDGRGIGTIESGTDGDDLWFRHAETGFSLEWLDDFAAQCRHHGRPITRTQLMNLLVEEWQICDRLLKAAAAGRTLARFVLDESTKGIFQVGVSMPPRTATLTVVATALKLIADDPGGQWQIWTGATWQPLPKPSTAEQDGSDR